MKFPLMLAAFLAIVCATILFLRTTRIAVAAQPSSSETFEQRYASLPRDALDRRARSNAMMRAESVPVNEWLPAVESEQEVTLPTAEKVAMRAAVTLVVALKGNGLPQQQVDELIAKYDLAASLSPNEAKFIRDLHPTEREKDIQTWRFEAAKALLWSVGLVDRLDGPRQFADFRALSAFILDNTRQTLGSKPNQHLDSVHEC